ncbi:tRNA dihydrouridine(20/20a) synthase DusA [Aquella oligotrophica]|uniref:tRNA-dihydrouridine(20/20a) synthase n=1 Tax=Aquella oligotrophica TaxID=2067065 RepID=A0A2I7N6T7_9NEIS|nr:tRNA dihydrouridine(20/20a) synthase DusA [Aquella oligotrophica]AUR52151.1 tRNA dihydrouridine(20/20a) synthase DusA [Aquella oligotrophica]
MLNNMPQIAIAPMLDWTDRHYRYFMRKISKKTILYTEMVVADAIIHGDRDKLLEFNPEEQHVVLQLGGSNPEKLATSTKIAVEYGYQEINLNCGCPSDRVQSGKFGACLMKEPELVADCIKAMQEVVSIPVTVKQRIGLDYDYDYDYCAKFVETIANAGCKSFIIHARNAVLKGLSPKDNREIPPLRYDYVYQLKKDFPDLNIMLNGGIKTTTDMINHLELVDGVMLGREAYYNPYLFANFDNQFFADNNPLRTRKEIALDMISYLENHLAQGHRLHHVTRHMIGLYHGCKKAKLWRQQLTTNIIKSNNIKDYIDLLGIMDE